MRRLPVRVRITAVAALVMGAGLVFTGLMYLRVVRDSQFAELRTNSRNRAQEVVGLVGNGKGIGRLAAARDDSLLVQVIDTDGKVIASSQNVSDMHAFAEGTRAGATGEVSRSRIEVDKVPCELLATSADFHGTHYVVFVAAPLRSIEHTERMLRSWLLRGAPLVLLGTIGAMWLVATRALRPVEVLRREVAAVSAADLSARVSAGPVDDELGRLGRTMNAMLERLQQASDRQKRFVSDASHELRTPLAVTRARLEVALRSERADWPAAAHDALRESGRMERLVRDLLVLASGESEVREARPVDLDEVVMEVVRSARLVAPPTATIDVSGVSGGRVVGSADALERVVANLVDNALRHAASIVRVSLQPSSSHAGMIELAVADDGPGVAAADRERVFERFTRLDEARDRLRGGTGLGLAIVAETVAANRGTVHVEDAPGGGARFVVRLPCTP